MATPIILQKKKCKPKMFSADELQHILPFKETFVKARTVKERLLILTNHILVAIFNYWASQECIPNVAQEIITWCSNNWRAERGIVQKSNHFCPKRPDILWHNHQPKIWVEIASIMGIDTASANTFGWFGHRTTAMKNVWTSMTDEEHKAIDEEVETCGMQGYDEHTQARSVI
ncbi:hypothetical protein CVT25_008019 [Psilocybe cyanescens]|uniref:Uncharacterized protein n=1 Tax=Psilocybe cyanescens TaxID=93625 RepID=A0A409XTX8_PSICY|nr:hypothetical protein CVT25_008019 [Psilocybe cyanescens]